MLGQTLSVRCRYTPQMGPYVRKSWCRQTSVGKCTRLVTTSRPRTAVTELRHAIWDDPQAGFFVINTTDLKEDDSGPYWCGNYNASENTIFILRNITLVVSSGETLLRERPLPGAPRAGLTHPGLRLHCPNPAKPSALIQGQRGALSQGWGLASTPPASLGASWGETVKAWGKESLSSSLSRTGTHTAQVCRLKALVPEGPALAPASPSALGPDLLPLPGPSG